jgi:hypothetical protein
MGRPPKITEVLRKELWRQYKAGETVLGIGRALGQRQATIHRLLQATGGIAPTRRSRSSRVLSFSEREEISRGVAAGSPMCPAGPFIGGAGGGNRTDGPY